LGKRNWELDVDANDEVSSLVWFLAAWHAEIWESFFPGWLCRTAMTNRNLFAVDGLNCAIPAGQCFLQAQVYGMSNVVAIALEERMWFL